MGMCSKCFREVHAEEAKKRAAEQAMVAAVAEVQAASSSKPVTEAAAAAAPLPAVLAPAEAVETTLTTEAAVASGSSDPPAEQPSPSKGSTRCLMCRKKLGLTGFKCKCGEMFCGQHRYAEAHKCTFDYKSAERAKLAENNPLVQAAKVQKI